MQSSCLNKLKHLEQVTGGSVSIQVPGSDRAERSIKMCRLYPTYTINKDAPHLSILKMTQIRVHIQKIPTHLSPVVELFQQIFVQVRGANGGNLLASDQSLQLLPGGLKVSQSLAVTLQGPRWRYDNRVKLGHCQRLAGWGWETNKAVSWVEFRFKKGSYQLWVIFKCWGKKCCWRDLKLTHLHCISDRGLNRLTQEQLDCENKATINMSSPTYLQLLCSIWLV